MFSVLEAFSFLLDNGLAALGSQHTMTHPPSTLLKRSEPELTTQTAMEAKIKHEMAEFQKTMQELHTLKKLSQDLRKYKRMLHIRKFD
jgi:hypothetical protein